MDIAQKISLIGARPTNEDKEFILMNKDGKHKNFAQVNLYAIFDGHGGSTVSKYVHDNLPLLFLSKNCIYPLKPKQINEFFGKVQTDLETKKYSEHMGTTAILLMTYTVNGIDYMNICNLGDCRAVLCRNNFGIPLTKDHKPSFPEEIRRITKLGGKITYDGMDWRIKDLSVSRAFGDVDTKPYVSHLPDNYKYRLDKDDKFIILACDGLWDVVNNQDAVNFVLNIYYDETTNNKLIKKRMNVAEELAKYAINKGSTDNVSIIIIFLGC
jgi:protein phosphatase 2C